MQTNTNPSGGAQPSDLLPAIYEVEVRNEEKISAADRIFCEQEQSEFYQTLEQIERCYAALRAEVERHRGCYEIAYKPNGSVSIRERDTTTDYHLAVSHLINRINDFVRLNYNIHTIFANRIVRYFNDTYHVSVPDPHIDRDTLAMGTRPVYTTFVDRVIEHLDGRNFRATAEEEIIHRFLGLVTSGRRATSKPELKGSKIAFPAIVSYNDFYIKLERRYQIPYDCNSTMDTFCEGIVFGADGRLDGSQKTILHLRADDIDLKRWYDTTTESGVQLQFFRNGRIDVKFGDADAAEACFRRLRLHDPLSTDNND